MGMGRDWRAMNSLFFFLTLKAIPNEFVSFLFARRKRVWMTTKPTEYSNVSNDIVRPTEKLRTSYVCLSCLSSPFSPLTQRNLFLCIYHDPRTQTHESREGRLRQPNDWMHKMPN